MRRTMPLTMMMVLMLLAKTATSAVTEDAVVNQEESLRQPKYSFPIQYLPLQAAHPPFVYQLPGMPLPLSYLPGQHIPGVIPAGSPASTAFVQRLMYPTAAASPASTAFIQRLMYPTAAAVPLAFQPQYATANDDVQFPGVTRGGDASACLTAATECLEYLQSFVPTVEISPANLPRSMMQGDDQLPTYSRNPVLQPVVLEERGDLPATYGGPLLSCVKFALKLPLNPQCILELPGTLLPIFCDFFEDLLATLQVDVIDVCPVPVRNGLPRSRLN